MSSFSRRRSDLRLLGVVYHHFGKPRTYKLRFRAHLFNDSECAINIHKGREYYAKRTPLTSATVNTRKKKHNLYGNVYLCHFFSTITYIPNHKP